MKKNIQLFIKKLSLTIFIIIVNNIYCQTNYSNYYFPEPPKAPSSKLFLTHGNIQNSEYSGSNSPSINLFSLKSGNITLPVNINYISGNGIRVNEEAGQVGLGWNIAFPTIVQNIYGYDDFANNTRFRLDFAKSTLPYASTFPLSTGATNFNQSPSFDTYGYFIATNNNVPRNGYFSNTFSDFAFVDMKPDIFVINLFGEKIEFIISNFNNYNPNTVSSIYFTVLNKKGYKIEKTNLGFTIKDPKGITYKFNNIENIGSYANGTLSQATGRNYHISEIIDTNNNKILFDYINTSVISNPPSYSWFLNYTINYYQNYCKEGSSGYLDFYSINEPAPTPNPNKFSSLNNFMSNVGGGESPQQMYLYPSSISSDSGKLVFIYSDRTDFETKKLDKISLMIGNTIVDECQFNYSYFLPQSVDASNIIYIGQGPYNYTSEKNKRLKLNSIQKTKEEKYTFFYNETLLPPKNSYATDYWGYSNGGFNNKSAHLNPNDFNYNVNIPVTDINNNNKLPNINYTKSGILEKIEYPTKGYSTFTYELNEAKNLFYTYDYYKYNNGNGLRLKEQKNFDNNNNLLGTTSFEYENGLTPNPIHMFRVDNGEQFFEFGYCAAKTVIKTNQAVFVSMHSSSISNTFTLSSGSGIGYSKVTRKEKDGNGNSKGSIETTYANKEDIHFGISSYNRPIFLPSVKGNKIENGSIMSKSIYNSNNIKLQEESYSYILQNSPFSYGVTMIHPMFHTYVVDQFSYVEHFKSAIGYYPIYSTETILQSKKNINYINGKSLVTDTNLYLNNYNQIISKSTKFPDGKYNIENIKYSTEKNNLRLISSNMLNIPLETELIGNNAEGSSKRTSLIETKYEDSNHLNPTSVLSYDINNTLSTEITYDKYDPKGNLQQYTTKDGIPVSIIWGYNQTQPIAKIEGAMYNQVAGFISGIIAASNTDMQQGTEASENALIAALEAFRNLPDLLTTQITTYTYKPQIGVTSITSTSGVRENYIYDSANRLEKIIDVNGKVLKEYKYNYKN
ncbi:hypothetical protein D1631_14280 [Chryseobacterium nematophagum]|uniref:RHS repeat protein n=1 Tax=Chryseobacterium nematophagum TaxID=2305228 RepID=A0A3M7TJ27_9FLAO|nr:hypothetical protein [Chryseobacterium nematophagum]RNA63016.1 hypothetical protein D1631_14280 [Chryseobacterium nematophagum]